MKSILLICLLTFSSLRINATEMPSPSLKLVQPQFKWANQTCTHQGTGSFIQSPNGAPIGLTSAHFINFSGPQLLTIEWLDMRTKKPIATSVSSWGMPGHEGDYSSLDLRSDYLLTVVEGPVDPQNLLELELANIEVGERIWFPNKNAKAPQGYDLIEGSVTEATGTYLLITLDRVVDLQSRSGSPILSQRTGKVIGILTGGNKKNNHSIIFLTPSSSIYKALLEAQQYPLLRDVVGVQK